jgi:hypothetical protein
MRPVPVASAPPLAGGRWTAGLPRMPLLVLRLESRGLQELKSPAVAAPLPIGTIITHMGSLVRERSA